MISTSDRAHRVRVRRVPPSSRMPRPRRRSTNAAARSTVRLQLHELAIDRGRRRGYAALDYFVFPKGLFNPVPPFLIGRACSTTGLSGARERGRPVVDATQSIVAVHQSHDYSHVPGGLDEAYYRTEARSTSSLPAAGSTCTRSTMRLTSCTRRGEHSRIGARCSARARRRARREGGGGRPHRGAQSSQEPGAPFGCWAYSQAADGALLLDALAEAGDVDLTVLYGDGARRCGGGTARSRPWVSAKRAGFADRSPSSDATTRSTGRSGTLAAPSGRTA